MNSTNRCNCNDDPGLNKFQFNCIICNVVTFEHYERPDKTIFGACSESCLNIVILREMNDEGN